MNSKDIDISLFKELSTGKSDPNQFDAVWPPGSELYFLPGYAILVHENNVLVFYANIKGAPQPVPKLGAMSSDELYPLPLNEKEVVAIFGKEDKFKDFFMH